MGFSVGNSYSLPEGPQVGAEVLLVLRHCSPVFPSPPPLSQEKATEPLGLEGVMTLAQVQGKETLGPCLSWALPSAPTLGCDSASKLGNTLGRSCDWLHSLS